MTNWKLLADALKLGASESELARIVPPMDALDTAFRQVLRVLPADADSAVVFRADLEAR